MVRGVIQRTVFSIEIREVNGLVGALLLHPALMDFRLVSESFFAAVGNVFEVCLTDFDDIDVGSKWIGYCGGEGFDASCDSRAGAAQLGFGFAAELLDVSAAGHEEHAGKCDSEMGAHGGGENHRKQSGLSMIDADVAITQAANLFGVRNRVLPRSKVLCQMTLA